MYYKLCVSCIPTYKFFTTPFNLFIITRFVDYFSLRDIAIYAVICKLITIRVVFLELSATSAFLTTGISEQSIRLLQYNVVALIFVSISSIHLITFTIRKIGSLHMHYVPFISQDL